MSLAVVAVSPAIVEPIVVAVSPAIVESIVVAISPAIVKSIVVAVVEFPLPQLRLCRSLRDDHLEVSLSAHTSQKDNH